MKKRKIRENKSQQTFGDIEDNTNIWDKNRLKRLFEILEENGGDGNDDEEEEEGGVREYFSVITKRSKKNTEISTVVIHDVLDEILLGRIFTYCNPFIPVVPFVCKAWFNVWKFDPVVGRSNPEYVKQSMRLFCEWSLELQPQRTEALIKLRNIGNEIKKLEEESDCGNDQMSPPPGFEIKMRDLHEKHQQEIDAFHDGIESKHKQRLKLYQCVVSSRGLAGGKWASAVLCGDIDVLEYLYKEHCERLTRTPEKTNILLSRPLNSFGRPIIESALLTEVVTNLAAKKGNIDVLRWLRNNTTVLFTFEVADIAASQQRWDIMEFVVSENIPCSAYAMACVAKHGQFNLLKALRSRSVSSAWDSRVYEYARANGHLKLAHWAKSNGCPC